MVLNRHGERAPDDDERSLSDRQEEILNITYLEGPEGLTNVGKRRANQIGKFLRQRYGSEGYGLISNLYLNNEIAIRSTEKDRTKMTILVAMAAVYPPVVEQQWDAGLGKVWQPVPYDSVPLKEDYLRYYSNCDRFITLMTEAKQKSLQEELAPYTNIIPLLEEKTGRNFTENPLLFQTLFDLFRSLDGLRISIPEWSKPLRPTIRDAATQAYGLYFKTDEMKKIGGGVLLQQFTEAAEDIISGKEVLKRLRLFSCHDFNLGALMEASNVKYERTIPEYGSVFALELYRSKTTGLYSVLPVYLPQAGKSNARILSINECGSSSYCDFNTFKDLTKKYLLPEQEYYCICNIRTEL
ncbi:unnamed protein product [Arctia plantaginis]|uniref:acid phosphatase n=1 Tax=Arctia plantaginis TaxID=874455 RepID=A0A8S1A7I2_ARCPL|nr:unnamed protein product [Arctia plantaginis]